MTSGEEGPVNGLKSVGKAFSILEIVVRNRAPMSLKRIAECANISPSKAHRYVQSLCACELLNQAQKSGHYDLGMAALRIGLSAINRIDIVNRAGEGLQTLGEELNADVVLSVWSDNGPMVVRYDRSLKPSNTMIGLGFAFPLLTSATGLVFAAFMEPETLRNAMEHAFDEDPDLYAGKASDVKSKYQHVEKQGYAYTRGSYLPGRECVAAPIFSIEDKIIATVTYTVKFTGEGAPDQNRVRLLLDFCQRYSLSKSGYSNHPQLDGAIAV